MAKLKLSTKVTLEIEDENGKAIEKFDVTYRELSNKLQKKVGKDNEVIIEVFNKGQKIGKRINALEAKLQALREMEKTKEISTTANELTALYKKVEPLDIKFDELGGFDKMREASKITFDLCVGGKDKETLIDFIEENSDFAEVLEELAKDAKEQKGK